MEFYELPTVALTGVNNFKQKGESGESETIKDLGFIDVYSRLNIVIVFDSDIVN